MPTLLMAWLILIQLYIIIELFLQSKYTKKEHNLVSVSMNPIQLSVLEISFKRPPVKLHQANS